MQKSEAEILSEIATKRRDHESRKKDIETEIRNRVETELAESWNDVRRAIWDAKRGGLAIAKIARAYGTTNRATIYSIVAEMPTYLAEEELTFLKTEEIRTVEDVKIVAHFTDMGPGFKLTWPDLKEPLEVADMGGNLLPLGQGENRERYRSNKDHYENLIRAL